mmetsp:Transcript_84493/g.148226  ORF Transcript_84493/g.148226 Transcript_84493/m.148226 type:complete len:95 (+) Transcript_84493:847-1131(+)
MYLSLVPTSWCDTCFLTIHLLKASCTQSLWWLQILIWLQFWIRCSDAWAVSVFTLCVSKPYILRTWLDHLWRQFCFVVSKGHLSHTAAFHCGDL